MIIRCTERNLVVKITISDGGCGTESFSHENFYILM